uniref:High affinity cationic amino acid transporter 1 n=1 Tax=Sarcoptes scabiei TaxID=52283 RepID=A0A834V901_SARSC
MKNIPLAIWIAFFRRKPIEPIIKTRLKKCLGTFDLTALGVGSTLGVGVYVIIGTVAYKLAGPSVVVSFLIAAISSIFAGLCYAGINFFTLISSNLMVCSFQEFGALVPRAGSAYIYSYICVGELMAFVIGWNLILEYIIGAASVARSYSVYLDGLCDNAIKNFLSKYLTLPQSDWFASYPDLFAFTLVMLLSVLLSFGVKESTQFTKIFTVVNFMVILYCVIVGAFKLDFHNWRIDPKEIPPEIDGGSGGFFPFGINGTIAGAAICFYSFVGFDAIATTGEEVLNPQRSLPISIIASLTLVTLAYCAVATVQTMMWPYWDQFHEPSLPYVFDRVGYPFAQKIITIGALAGLSTSLIGGMFPMPRIIYAMADDRLLFNFLAKINNRFKTPVIATMISGLLAAVMAMFFDIDQLAEMMSIGTLLAYILVAISILILRYKQATNNPILIADQSSTSSSSSSHLANSENDIRDITVRESFWKRLINYQKITVPDSFSSSISLNLIAFTTILIFIFNVIFALNEEDVYHLTLSKERASILVILFLLIFVSTILLSCQPKSKLGSSFSVPFVPFIPFLSVFTNIYLMVHLNILTWYRFIGWMILGFIVYFGYGIVKSTGYLTQEEKSRLLLNDDTPQELEDDGEVTFESISS